MRLPASLLFLAVSASAALANPNVYVSRFWHNHQPIYWPEWNSNGSQTQRGQYAWDSIVLKPGQNYGGLSPAQHPENNLTDIFGLDDRRNAYQSGPRNSLASFDSRGGFAISYSGSLIDNVRQLGSVNQLGYGSGWANGYREARGWLTPSGSTRMDLVGFTYHHSLAPLLPKSVFRKELQIFKQAWWKAWNGNPNLSDHSKGFFPTEMAYSRHLIDVLVDEGYQWVIVPSHHISRTSPSYNDRANPAGTYNIYSSPPNKADQIGPRFDNVSQWWYSEPNPGNAAWNVSPYAYQLHRVKYVNPSTGAEKSMIAVPSDDVLSYRYGYANEGIGKIGSFISPHATDPARPVIVMPSTDGDNAWGGGSSSWNEATPQFFNGSASAGYRPTAPQDFVNAHGAAAPMAHIEDGAWIFPEMDYGAPNFLKWIEPPVANSATGATNRVPGTQIDMETPGFALKFFSYAPLMAGANWVETAEQILRDEGGSVEAWKIQAPYDWNGAWNSPNDVELAWHIYLKGLDSGFNYYGGLGNDDEVKPALATKRAIDRLTPWMTTQRRDNDRTPPTVLKPQRFPYNPGAYTFGWFNRIPGSDTSFLKRMNSEFYVWTHAYDLSGIPDGSVVLKIRIDNDGTNPLASNENETYTGGSEVGSWVSIPMTKRVLPKTRAALNTAAANGQIDYFVFDPAFWSDPVIADYYFAKITETNLPGFRNKLLDYYIEATDAKGNVSRSEIQHVWVDDFSGAGGGGGGGGGGSDTVVTTSPTPPVAGQQVTVTYNPAGRNLASATNVNIHHGYNGANWTAVPGVPMTKTGTNWTYSYIVPTNATTLAMVFNNNAGTWDNNGGGNWNFAVNNQPPPTEPPPAPTGLTGSSESASEVLLSWNAAATAASYKVFRNGGGSPVATVQGTSFVDTGLTAETTYSYRIVASNVAGDSPLSDPVGVTTWFAPVLADGIRITSPSGASSLPAGTTNYLFLGHAGRLFTNGLIWTNPLTGGSGTVPFTGVTNTNGWAWSVPIPVAPGSNNVTFSAAYSTGGTLVTGSDSPTNYTSWNNGSTGGTGFGPWAFSNTTNAGFFLADNATNMNVGATKGFGLWANNGGLSVARRPLPSAMNPGDSVAVRIDNNWINNGGRVGFALANASASNRFNFYFVGGQTTYRVDDASTNRDSGTAYTDGGMLVTFTLTGTNTYSVTTGGNAPLTGTLGGSGPITQLVFSNSTSGPDTPYNFYVGAMTYSASQPSSATNSTNAPILTVQAGSVTDGLPDAWWTQFFSNPADWVAAADSDGDGFTNAEEHALGTNPAQAGSRFAVREAHRGAQGMTIEWSSVAGKKYRLQARPSLTDGSWQDVGDEITASGATTSTNHDSASGQHFYRVRLVP